MQKHFFTLSLILLLFTAAPLLAQQEVLLLKGLGCETLFPEAAMSKTGALNIRTAYLARLQTGYALDTPFPRQVSALKEVGVIVMADIPVSALNGFMGRRALRQFVANGGGLLIFGGPLSFGKGEITGSLLEDMLPVITTGPWDLQQAVNPIVQQSKISPFTKELLWEQKPRVYYYQKVIARPGAEVLLSCDGNPLLVIGKYGQGRIAVMMSTMLGGPRAGETFCYDWSGYQPLLQRLMGWLQGKK